MKNAPGAPSVVLSFFRRNFLFSLTAFLLSTVCGAAPATARVSLSKLFVDGGIIQRDKPVNVFGTARPGEIITCEIDGHRGVCIVNKRGNFLVSLPAVTGDGPFKLRVVGDNLIEIKNLVPGEIWIVAGDADVDMDPLRAGQVVDPSELPPTLQLFKVGVNYEAAPVRLIYGNWLKADGPGAMAFSALGLRYGCALAKQVGGPIGIIQISCPDSPIKSWISEGGLLSQPETRSAASKATLTAADFDKLKIEYQDNLNKWQTGLVSGKEPPPLPLPSQLVRNSPSALFNGMVAPLTPLSIRGLIWYHGESDLAEVLNYKNFLAAFLKDFRQVFRQDGLPVILVQSGALPEAQKGDESPVSILRNVQLKARIWPRTYMAVSVDLDRKEAKSTTFKIDFATLTQRLTNIALATQYHTPAASNYPIIDTVEAIKDGEALKLHMRYAKGLKSSESSNTSSNESSNASNNTSSSEKGTEKNKIKGFGISSWNHQFFDADVTQDGDSLIVESKFVKTPKYVRYCWGNSPTLTLYNSDGLPLVPCITDR